MVRYPTMVLTDCCQTAPLQVAAFCIDKTRRGSINGAAGFPWPGGLLLPTAACIKPSCP